MEMSMWRNTSAAIGSGREWSIGICVNLPNSITAKLNYRQMQLPPNAIAAKRNCRQTQLPPNAIAAKCNCRQTQLPPNAKGPGQ
jgi:hypothetical protein